MASSDRSEWKARIERALTELKGDASEIARDERSASHSAQKTSSDASSAMSR